MLAASSIQLILYLMFAVCPLLVKTEVLVYSDVGVLAQGETSGKEHHRERRRVTTTTQGFNDEQKRAILQHHNHLRTLAKASNMLKMEWNPQLESHSQNYAAQCKFDHNLNRYNVAGFGAVGENLYATTGDFDPVDFVQDWYDEVKHYNYTTGECNQGKVCGHYKQVVWANSRSLGCGVKFCEHLEKTKFNRGYIIVCNYGPGGNYIGQKPYVLGEPCSQCPKEKKICNKGLCALRPQIGSDISLAQNPAPENASPSNQTFVFTAILSLFVMAVQLK